MDQNIDPDLIEHIAKTLCEESRGEWKTGTWRCLSGTDEVNNKMFWEDHDLDQYNNHWRDTAKTIILAIKEFENGTGN